MVRTKADSCASSRKVIAAQAPRKSLGGAGPSSSSSDGGSPAGKGKFAGGNPVCARPTPEWQKGIATFFQKPDSSSQSSSSSTSSSSSSTASSSSSSASVSQEEVATGSRSTDS